MFCPFPIAENDLFVDAETIDDLKRLSSIFEHVEKLVTLAVSLHRKFMHAPRLSEAIFNDYINFYIPKMGTASGGGGDTKVGIYFSRFSTHYHLSGSAKDHVV